MSCFSCGKTFSGSVNDLLQKYKRDYIENGVERYFFKERKDGDILICRKSQFKTVFNQRIKPNFPNGAEWGHIREYNV